MPTTITTVLLSTKGETRRANLTLDDDGRLPIESVQKYFRKKDAPEELGYYEVDDRIFYLVGYKKGKSGTENKTELPEPYAKQKFFGDILVLATESNWQDEPQGLTLDAWKRFLDGSLDQASEASSGASSSDSDEESVAEDIEEEVLEEDEDDGLDDDDTEGEEEELYDLEEADEMEAEPLSSRKKKNISTAAKVDTTAFKEQLEPDTPATSYPIRQATLEHLGFLEEKFKAEAINALEMAIFKVALENATKVFIPRSWKSQPFRDIYKQVCRSVLWNIHPSSPVGNGRLIQRALEGEFELAAIPAMTSYEMFPEHWKTMADKQLIREQKILEGDKSRATDAYKCHRCGKRECTYYELQTRSADEPMTIFIACVNCGKRWRQ
jgi:transcription elongation factor S-II